MRLKISQLKFKLMATEKIILSKNPGSIFRGAFGQALRTLCCSSNLDDCSECDYNLCVYANFFNPHLSAEEKKEVSNRYQNKPRPFVFEFDTTGKEVFYPGEMIRFKMNIFGKDSLYLPYIIESWRSLEELGIGSNRGKFILFDIWKVNNFSGDAKRIYFFKNKEINDWDININFGDIIERSSLFNKNKIKLFFPSPLLLKYKGEYVNQLEFHILIRNLYRRLSSLSQFYGEEKLDIDFNSSIERAEEVKVIEDNTQWTEWSRYSNRQQKEIKMYGLVGDITYSGNLEDYLKFLIWGQYTHIGKNTVFGQGNYIIS